MEKFDELVKVMHRLRVECPWDRKQTLDSLRPYLLEETYECLEALERREIDGVEPLVEELGDVLLQILFQSEILSETLNRPVIEDVIQTLVDKLKRRHPHVFGEAKEVSAEEVIQTWNEIKKSEKESKLQKSQDAPPFGEMKTLPALLAAYEIGKFSSKIKFDWDKPEEVYQQLQKEWKEFEDAKTEREKEEEIGDILFCMAQYARHLKIQPELSLWNSNRKFMLRFQIMQRLVAERKLNWETLSNAQKEELWEAAKSEAKKEASATDTSRG